MAWYVYVVECADGMLYTGTTINLKRRVHEHNYDNKFGSRFVRVRRPVRLIYSEVVTTRSDALKREIEIKGWSRKKKLKFILGQTLTETSEGKPAPESR